jgi:hypothetical protein
MRDTTGRFTAGMSGNPGGRPRIIGHVRDMAQRHADDAIDVLAEIMRQSDAPASARIAAASAMLDRAYGRPVDQRAMVVLSRGMDLDIAAPDMPMDVLLRELARMADDGLLDARLLPRAGGS